MKDGIANETQSYLTILNSKKNSIGTKFISCPSCKKNISPRAIKCPECNITINKECDVCLKSVIIDSIFCPKCGDPDPFSASNNIDQHIPETGILLDCPFCEKSISNRSNKCIYCYSHMNIPCPLCKIKISIWDNSCSECGEPDPLSKILHSPENNSETLSITRIKINSQAETLGFKVNDIIVSYNSFEITNNDDLTGAVQIARDENINEVIIVVSRYARKIFFTVKTEPLGISCESERVKKNIDKNNSQKEYYCEDCGLIFDLEGKSFTLLKHVCPKCKGYIRDKVKETVKAPESSAIPLRKCACGHKTSMRARKCPKCGGLLCAKCLVCKSKIEALTKVCNYCGDPDPFDDDFHVPNFPVKLLEYKYQADGVWVQVNSPKIFIDWFKNGKITIKTLASKSSATDNTHLLTLNKLDGFTDFIEQFTSDKQSENVNIVTCPVCQHNVSERAGKCVKCGSSTQTATCLVCHKDIPINSSNCSECGDPSPLKIDNAKTSLTSYNKKQKIEPPVTTTTKSTRFSLSWFLFSFDGRISRQTFWYAYPVIFVFSLILSVSVEIVKETLNKNHLIIIAILLPLLLWPSLAIQAKRWHDRNKSANWIIINMIPLIGFLWIIIELGFFKGTEGNNDYGKDPLSNS